MSDRSSKLFRLLTWLFPSEFRRRHSNDMLQVFLDRCRERGLLGAWIEAAPDIVRSAVVERWRALVRLSYGPHHWILFHPFEAARRAREIPAGNAEPLSPFPYAFRPPFFFARYSAAFAGSPEIRPVHLLGGLLRANPELARSLFGERERHLIDHVMKYGRSRARPEAIKPRSVDLPLSEECEQIVAQATAQALMEGKREPELADLFRAFTRQAQGRAAHWLREAGYSDPGAGTS